MKKENRIMRIGKTKKTKQMIKALLFAVTLICCAATALADDRTEGVTYASSVFIHENGVAFWGWNDALCSALVNEDGSLYDFVQEGTMSSDISELAILDNYLYVATRDGLCRLDLSNTEGTTAVELLNDYSLGDGFEIYNGYIYFRYGYSLYRMPESGGEKEKLLSGITDYLVTNEAIYYTDSDGGLFSIDLDGGNKAFLTDTPESSNITLYGDILYFYGEEDDRIRTCSLTDGTIGEYITGYSVDGYYHIWVTDTYFVYTADGYDVYLYDFATGEETQAEFASTTPHRYTATFLDGKLYYFQGNMLNIEDYDRNCNEMLKMSDVLTAGTNSGSSSDTDEEVVVIGGEEADTYDIGTGAQVSSSEGVVRFENAYFELYMPSSVDWSYEIYDTETIHFFYPAAVSSGYDGIFLTIKAYDWGEDEYADFPAWSVAGLSDEKKYIAIFPTDACYDVNDAAQSADFQTLLAFAETIDDGSVDSPFIVY